MTIDAYSYMQFCVCSLQKSQRNSRLERINTVEEKKKGVRKHQRKTEMLASRRAKIICV